MYLYSKKGYEILQTHTVLYLCLPYPCLLSWQGRVSENPIHTSLSMQHTSYLQAHTEHLRAKHRFNTKDCSILTVFIARDLCRQGHVSHCTLSIDSHSALTLGCAGYSSPSPAPPSPPCTSPSKPRERASLHSLSFVNSHRHSFQTLSIQLRRNGWWKEK